MRPLLAAPRLQGCEASTTGSFSLTSLTSTTTVVPMLLMEMLERPGSSTMVRSSADLRSTFLMLAPRLIPDSATASTICSLLTASLPTTSMVQHSRDIHPRKRQKRRTPSATPTRLR